MISGCNWPLIQTKWQIIWPPGSANSTVTLTCQPQANGLFAVMPREAIERLRKEYFFYDWDEERNEVRWMCSFDTTREDIDRFIAVLKRILSHG